jgi:acetyl/propionyl-CoA carboxylase alpha subunit
MATINMSLLANCGEVAWHVNSALRALFIRPKKVYSEASQNMSNIKDSDEVVSIGPESPKEYFLAVEKLLAAAKRLPTEAIYKRNGVLAENSEIAQRMTNIGMSFIGPSHQCTRQMLNKKEARLCSEDLSGVFLMSTIKPATVQALRWPLHSSRAAARVPVFPRSSRPKRGKTFKAARCIQASWVIASNDPKLQRSSCE